MRVGLPTGRVVSERLRRGGGGIGVGGARRGSLVLVARREIPAYRRFRVSRWSPAARGAQSGRLATGKRPTAHRCRAVGREAVARRPESAPPRVAAGAGARHRRRSHFPSPSRPRASRAARAVVLGAQAPGAAARGEAAGVANGSVMEGGMGVGSARRRPHFGSRDGKSPRIDGFSSRDGRRRRALPAGVGREVVAWRPESAPSRVAAGAGASHRRRCSFPSPSRPRAQRATTSPRAERHQQKNRPQKKVSASSAAGRRSSG
jgi:hypothetical protein